MTTIPSSYIHSTSVRAGSAEHGRPLAALLLTAGMSALAVLADQMIDTWVDGHLLLAWVLLWVVVFAGTLLLAGTAHRVGQRIMRTLDRWAHRQAQRRAETRRQRLQARSTPATITPAVPSHDRFETLVQTMARSHQSRASIYHI